MTFKIVITLSFLLAGCQQSQAPSQSTQRYQVVAGADGAAWKIDTQTGTTWLCTKTETAKIVLGSSCSVSKDDNQLSPNPTQ